VFRLGGFFGNGFIVACADLIVAVVLMTFLPGGALLDGIVWVLLLRCPTDCGCGVCA
jgi:hypothetical protein